MITRFEMQTNAPDILITNYSMLEYMLMRTIEQGIWKQTKEWLSEDVNNKLLFIIDEAHMYKGASGGEVALLIRRLLNKLELPRNRVQFILTTASMPSNSDEIIKKFYCDLTANDNAENFCYIKGIREKISYDNSYECDPLLLSSFDISLLHSNETKLEAIKRFGELSKLDINTCSFEKGQEVEQWLFANLQKLSPLLRVMDKCRGNATAFNDLAKVAFPNIDQKIAQKATSVLLAIAPMAKDSNGSVLFPSRLHMMFRGMQGLYACSNPNCTEKKIKNNLPIGKIYFGTHDDVCKCGGRIYELTFVYGVENLYDRSEANRVLLVTNKELPKVIVNASDVAGYAGEEVSIKGTVTDEFGNPINRNNLIIKINGKTIMDGSLPLYYSTINGTFEDILLIPNYSAKAYELQYVYLQTDKYERYELNKTLTIKRQPSKISFVYDEDHPYYYPADVTYIASGESLYFGVAVNGLVTGNIASSGNISLKINGKLYQINNKTLIAPIKDNMAVFKYTIPKTAKPGSVFKLTLLYSGSSNFYASEVGCTVVVQ